MSQVTCDLSNKRSWLPSAGKRKLREASTPIHLSTMASPFGLPPLLSTTASASIAIYEAILFNGLIKASLHDKSSTARTISLWWKTTLPEGLAVILALGLTSTLSGIRAVRAFRSGSRERYVAIAGTLFAVGHFLFGPSVARIIQRMVEAYDGLGGIEAREEGRGEVVDERVVELQRRWLRVHAWRSLVMDGPAVLCFGWLVIER